MSNEEGSNHSPAPWTIAGEFQDGASVAVRDAQNNLVFDIGPPEESWNETSVINVHLAACSPDLFRGAYVAYELCDSLLASREGVTEAMIRNVRDTLLSALVKLDLP